ncbi:protein snail [Zeugodacus cucurbitae]|uniref:protein snail n=1 Tax=Zeugodacus cucurbitae TaxID=28588 RepID=UPI0010A73E38|nr:protein snail [Zeugodacus cucurbitae]
MLPALSSNNSAHQLHLDNNNSASQQQQQQALAHSQQQQQQQRSNKRSTSMIFRIEHLLPSTSRGPPCIAPTTTTSASLICDRHSPTYTITGGATSSSTSSATTVKRAKQRATCNGVLLSQFTPKDTLSEPIPTYALMSAGNIATSEQTVTACCTLSQGVLRMSPELLRRIKLSEDIHSYNALFELQAGGMVHVRTVRDVARDEELVAWFGEEIALLMSIPFLTPLNIQGNKRYTCHLCQLTFETPNPLKIHLALGCGRHSMDILWIRLHYALKATSYTQQQHSPTAAPSSTSSISPASSPQPPQQPPQVQRFSAFKPVSPSIAFTAAVSTSSFSHPHAHTSTAVTPSTALSYLPPITSVGGTLSHMRLLQPSGSVGIGPTNPLNAAAQIEAIVSNMGASKQGHLCIYCGKVYSRKYGLKIHIRTHTGFKPLKCKFCLRPFGDPSNLNKHVRLHLQSNVPNTPVEGYKCTLCNKTLARRRDLQRHIESRHSGDVGST